VRRQLLVHCRDRLKRNNSALEPGFEHQIAILADIGADIEHDRGAGRYQDFFQYLMLNVRVFEALDLPPQLPQHALNEAFD
jgi:hypothetical protein